MKFAERLDHARAWGSGLARQREALVRSGVEVGYVSVEGLRIRYARSAGTGPPLLLCNGIGANLELALPFVRAMTGTPMVLFDLPGVGGSPAAPFWPGLRRYARLAVGVLDAIGLGGAFAVAGVSWGGALAQTIARQYPERITHLVLMATSPGILMVPGRPSALLRMATPQRYLSRTFMARHAAAIYGGELRGHPEWAIEFAGMTRAPATSAYLQQLLATLTFTSLPWLHRVRCPSLVITGDDDPIVRPINARILAALLPDARLHVMEGGGHLFMVMRADETAALVTAFLREKGPGPGRAQCS